MESRQSRRQFVFGTRGLWAFKSTDVTCSGSLSAVLPTMTYGTTQHLALEPSQTFAPLTSSHNAHSWKSRFLTGIPGPSCHSLCVWSTASALYLAHSWKPTREENAPETLCKNPLLHTQVDRQARTHTHHLSPSGGANCWSLRRGEGNLLETFV